MSSRPELKIDWCSHAAAKYAVEHWHYSKAMPVGKSVKIGAWENGKYIGVVVFGMGANPAMASTVGLTMFQCAELVRVALTDHETPVTRIVAIAIRFLCRANPGLRCLVSYADPYHGHHGGIYQGGGWIYIGVTQPETRYMHHGKMLMRRGFTGTVFGRDSAKLPVGATKIKVPGKYKYLMPLDDEMRRQIEPLRKPYPKRVRSVDSDTPASQPESGGAIPTRTLSESSE
jgi:hypothetical protein